MIAAFVCALQLLACLGYGGLVLRFTDCQSTLRADEQIAWALGLGSGIIGWLVFFLGIGSLFHETAFLVLLVVGACGCVVIKDAVVTCGRDVLAWQPDRREIFCLGVIGVVAGLFLAGAVVPPTDADSLAYHFHLPKHFMSLGHLEFIPRAADGAVPMLAQMAYLPVYGLGGEMGLTLWVAANGAIAAFLLFTLCRRYLSTTWSMLVTLLFITVPAFVYGAGSGQVEVRISIFVMIAAFSLAAAIETGMLRYAVLCGIAVGFFMGSKYTGLLFALSCGIVILMQKRWLIHGLVLTVVAVLIGSQWYIWNAIHTGDPVFPMLFDALRDTVNYRHWDAQQNRLFVDQFLTSERIFETTIADFFRYPVAATFLDLEGLEASRTGLGPFGFVAMPFAVFFLWTSRDGFEKNALFIVTALSLVFICVWFFAGSPQRVRHLLPIYPVLLLAISMMAYRGASIVSSSVILASGIIATLLIQVGGTMFFSFSTIKDLIHGTQRAQFFSARVTNYAPVQWINESLKPAGRVYIEQRELAYLIEAPVFVGHGVTQNLIRAHDRNVDPLKLRKQLLNQGITHLFLPTSRLRELPFSELVTTGCIKELKVFESETRQSRTLASNNLKTGQTGRYSVAALLGKTC